MKNYLINKLAMVPVLIIGVTFLVFLLLWALPGDPTLALAGKRASREAVEQIREGLGLDRPFLAQYWGYLKLVLRGELGRSYFTNHPVASELMEKLPNTLALALGAMTVAVPVGVLSGLLMAARRFRPEDRILGLLSMAGVSMPVFWIGLILMLLIGVKARLLPPSGTGGLAYLILPAMTLAVPAGSSIARVTRTVAVDIMNQPFILTARAKGLKGGRVVLGHVMKNSLIPVVTVIGLDFGSYLNGAVLTETIFGWDGVGRLAMEAILKRDYPVILGTVLLGTAAFIMVNLIVDLAYAAMDPRVRHASSQEGQT